MSVGKLTGPKKAAILLLALGEDAAAEVLKNLEEVEIQQVGYFMTRFTDIAPEEVDIVLEEFYRNSVTQEEGVNINASPDFVRNALNKAVGPDRAKELSDNLSATGEDSGLDALRFIEPVMISNYIRNEHPQTIALVLSYLSNLEQASTVLRTLPESVQADVIINVQGDEPFIDSNSLRALIDCFREDQEQRIDLASLMVAITDKTSIDNPNVVKVVTDLSGKALYFSRSAIPFHRDPSPEACCYKHKGVYAFRRSALLAFPKLIMGPLERAEKIEAIRYLEHGKRLQMIETSVDAPGIDTRADLEDAIANFKKLNS